MPSVYAQWDIWQVNWKHEDGSSKPRPALLISSTEYNENNEALAFIKISGIKHDIPYRLDLGVKDASFATTKLEKQSYIYCANVQKIKKKSILYQRGYADLALIRRVMRIIGAATGYQYP